jgi:NAD(P)H-dependent FMN reductase
VKILTLVGSLQSRSSNGALVALAARRAPPGVQMAPCALIGALPHYNADLDTAEPPPTVAQWRDELRAADGVLIASPEFGHGMPGSLKNALDWIVSSGGLVGKPVAATCAAQGPERGRMGLAMLTQTLRAIDATIVWSEPVIVPRASIDPQGDITDPEVERQIDVVVSTLAAAAIAGAKTEGGSPPGT